MSGDPRLVKQDFSTRVEALSLFQETTGPPVLLSGQLKRRKILEFFQVWSVKINKISLGRYEIV